MTNRPAPPPPIAPPERLYGRDELLADVLALLRNERWVTLHGPAGIGKSGLARELRRRVAATAVEGESTFFCELVDVDSVASLADAIARSLGLELRDSDPASLGRVLGGVGRSLVVLDGLAAGIVPPESWLEARGVRFLVTARRRLGLGQEAAVEVGPLEGPSERDDRDPLECAAGQLFEARAGRPAWLGPQSDRVKALLRSLHGNPLAIELVARTLARRTSVVEALSLFDGSNAGRDADPVLAAVACSWSELDADAQADVGRLSVFPASFTATAAAAVLGRPSAVQLLIESSLVHAFIEPRSGEERLRLHDAVRAFAAARLCESARREAIAAHALHYGAFGAELVARLERRHEDDLVLRGQLETPNLVAALRRAGRENPAAAAAAGLALEPDLTARGRYEDALDLAEECLRAALASGDLRLLARATAMRGEVRRRRSLRGAMDDHVAAVRVGASDPVLSARLLRSLGAVQRDLGKLAEATVTLELAHKSLKGADAPRELALVELALAVLHRRLDEPELSLVHAEFARATAQSAGDRLVEGRALLTLGLLHDDGGALEMALELVEEATRVLHANGDRWMEEMAHNAAGLLHAELGRFVEARGCFHEALSICEDAGFGAGLSCVTGNLGWLELAVGRPDRAALRFRHSLAQATAVGYRFAEALYGASLAALEASRDRVEAAQQAMAAAVDAAADCACPALTTTVTVLDGVLDVALARRAAAIGDSSEAAAHLARAERRLALGRMQRRPDGDLRNAVRALSRALSAAVASETPAETLQLRHADRVAILSGRQVALTKHPSLWRMLLCLTRAIHPVTVDGLFAAGWPGERIGRGAARNRVHVGLSTLRKLGLAGLFVSSDEGYRLAPHVSVSQRETTAA